MRGALLAFAGLVLASSSLQAAPPSAESMEQARKFGALESIRHIALSPDGNRAVFIGFSQQLQAIYVADLVNGGLPTAILRLNPANGTLDWCRWVNSQRMVCQAHTTLDQAGDLYTVSRLFALNADGSNQVRLTAGHSLRAIDFAAWGGSIIDWDLPNAPNSVLAARVWVEESNIGSNIRRENEGIGVEVVDTVSLKRNKVEEPRREASRYLTDGHGTVRVMGSYDRAGTGMLRGTMRYYFRRPGSREWERLSTSSFEEWQEGSFEPIAVDLNSNVAFGLGDNNGMTALYRIALDGSLRRELVLSRSDVDIDSLVRIGRDNRVVGASYATERRTTEFFDPELRKLSASLSKALPGHPGISFVDASAGEGKLLLMAWSDTNPGMFYVYDKASHHLAEVLPVRAELQGATLANVVPVTYPAADGTQIPAYLTLPPGSSGKGLPAIVMPHGGPGARDEWGFDWLAQFFAARGYAVLQPNYRGSAGYGAKWYEKNGFQSWRIAIGDVNDAGRWLLHEGIAAPGKLGIVGWSYGGYAALQSSVLDPDLFKAIVAIAPVTDLEKTRQAADGWTNFRIVDKFIGTGPHVREGSPAQNAQSIKAPVLLFHGSEDTNVDIDQSRLMDERLRGAGKRVTLVEFPGLAHDLGDSSARTRVLSESDAFLREAFGMAP
ncbi:MAG: alpha/beta fold hydrolase [Novosphingobium sp.]